MKLPSFEQFFAAAYGQDPFPWQSDLAREVVEAGWPDWIEVPTGLGKTAVLDIALFALARQAELSPEARTAPTRTYLVVDRRLVVDQAANRMARLVSRIEESTDGPLHAVRLALESIGRPDPSGRARERIVEVVRMRGGATWASRWVRRPDLPAVVTGTVDQFGSRLLFRGYGVGTRRLPIDAALVGTDALVIVDEAHLSRPFIDTVATVRYYEQTAQRAPLPSRPLRLVGMSATVGREGSRRFVTDRDRSSPTAGPRIRARKLARLVELRGAAAKKPETLAEAMVSLAAACLNDGSMRVLVVLNTVGAARRVHDALLAAGKSSALLVGRVRPFERRLIEKEIEAFQVGASAGDDPRVLVATQTVEVGVDLDVDSLVTESAPIDSLVQRFGRLDRLGRRGTTAAFIVHAAREKPDPIYGDATAKTWKALVELAGGSLVTDRPNAVVTNDSRYVVDFGIDALDRQLPAEQRAPLLPPSSRAPIILPRVADVWARTSPIPAVDEPVAPYLHGLDGGAAVVAVAWRAVPAEQDPIGALRQSLVVVPLRSEELVEVPIHEVTRFVAGLDDDGTSADVPTAPPMTNEVPPPSRPAVIVVDGEVRTVRHAAADIRPGAVVVLPSWVGGHDRWGWTGRRGGSVPDVADLVRPGGTVRLEREVLRSMGLDVDPPTAGDSEDFDATLEETKTWIRSARDVVDDDPLRVAWRGLLPVDLPLRLGYVGSPPVRDVALVAPIDPDNASAGLLIRWRPPGRYESERSDDDPFQTSLLMDPVPLPVHSRAVRDRAVAIGTRIGLPQDIVNAVALAAVAHDLGKADPRFQIRLNGGDRIAAEARDVPLAKSGGRWNTGDDRRAARLAGWPAGLRHERLSLAVVDAVLDGHEQIDHELVWHLVASHHGHARPLFAPVVVGDATAFTVRHPDDGSVVLNTSGIDSHIDWDHPDRFARLCRRYGRLGLALLETVIRTADQTISEEGS